MKHALLSIFAALGFFPLNAFAQTPVVVELYTSQSCANCPKADALLEKLASEKDLITLGCHVDYWDHLDWKDGMSVAACTARQRDFGAKLEGGRIYTPEIIINGRANMVGYREDQVRAAIAKQKTDTKTRALTFAREGDTLSVLFPDLPAGQQIPYVVTLMTYGAEKHVKIGSGENGGLGVTYVKPVMSVTKLDAWQGKAGKRVLPVFASDDGVKGLVVTVQAEPGAPIIAAGEMKL